MSWSGVATGCQEQRLGGTARAGLQTWLLWPPRASKATAPTAAAHRRATHPQRQLRPGALREGDADGAAHEVGVVRLLHSVLQAGRATGARAGMARRGSRHSSALSLGRQLARPLHQVPPVSPPSRVCTRLNRTANHGIRHSHGQAALRGASPGSELRAAPGQVCRLCRCVPLPAHLCVTLVEEAHERETAGLAGGVVLQQPEPAGVSGIQGTQGGRCRRESHTEVPGVRTRGMYTSPILPKRVNCGAGAGRGWSASAGCTREWGQGP